MLSTNQGELPTNKKNRSNLDAVRHQLFHHYLNHRYRDIPNSNLTSSKKVIEGIIEQFSKKYRPEKYFRNSEGLEDQISYNTKDDSLEDIISNTIEDRILKKKQDRAHFHREQNKKIDAMMKMLNTK